MAIKQLRLLLLVEPAQREVELTAIARFFTHARPLNMVRVAHGMSLCAIMRTEIILVRMMTYFYGTQLLVARACSSVLIIVRVGLWGCRTA